MLHFLVTLQTLIAERVERNDKGATMVEYGLMVALIAVVCIVAVGLIGERLDAMFDGVANELPAAP